MKQRRRIYYTDGQKALMWERSRKGESLQTIAATVTPVTTASTPIQNFSIDVSACCSFSSTIASLVRPSPTRRFSSICAAMSNDRCWRVAASADEKWAGSCGLFVVYALAARIQLQHCAPYQMMNGRDAR